MFQTGPSGEPLPFGNVFWSLSHKPGFVAGVAAMEPVGIDIEEPRPIPEAVFQKIVDPNEWSHFKDQGREAVFFRSFTAKEAVLKKAGIGFKGLFNTKVIQVLNERHLVAQCQGKKYLIENFYFDGGLASVTKDNLDIEWICR